MFAGSMVCAYVFVYVCMCLSIYMLLSQKLLRFIRDLTVAFEAGLSA